MPETVQPDDFAVNDDPPALLLRAVTPRLRPWLHRTCGAAIETDARAADRPSSEVEALETALCDAIEDAAHDIEVRLGEFLATDVDEQTTTPLAICRRAVTGPVEVLRRFGVAAVLRPDAVPADGDEYGIGPAAWGDIDVSLHEPGLSWGAWKAMTVLRRRRDEGRR